MTKVIARRRTPAARFVDGLLTPLGSSLVVPETRNPPDRSSLDASVEGRGKTFQAPNLGQAANLGEGNHI